MHKYEELEKLYYKKLYIKYFIYFSVLIVSVFLISFIYFSINKSTIKSKNLKKNIKEVNTSIQKNSKPKIKKPKPKQQKYVKKLTLYPIYPDISNFQEKKTKSKEAKNKYKEIKKVQSIQQPKKIEKPKPKKPEIKIVIKTETINDLINMYNLNPEFNNGMKIAKYYFNHKKYEESIKWCKKVNKIKPEDYKSWYLFAKNLIQLNKNKEAKKVLIYYISNYSPNDKIEKLLRSIK